MRAWSLVAFSVCVNLVACAETDDAAPANTRQSGQAGQSTNDAGQAGESAEPPLDDRDESAGAGGAGGADSPSPGADSAGASGADAGELTSITIAPLALTPAFSRSISDYYVRCAAGDNALTLTTSRAGEEESRELTLQPDQLVSVDDQYWVRCLPPDFPAFTVTKKGTPTPGYYLANSNTYGIVFDTEGVPVWYARGSGALNVDSPAPNTISLMLNFDDDFSSFEVRDLKNDLTQTVTGADDVSADGHELQVLPNGNHLLFVTPVQSGFDLTGLQDLGPEQNILGCVVQEVDPAGNLVWSWDAADHIDPVQESLTPSGTAASEFIDVYHCNSIDVDATGNLLISVRHASALYYVERSTGLVSWKLGGSAFSKDGAALIQVEGDSQSTFSKQHDARFRANGNVTLFDDHGVGVGVARGIEYALDHANGVATPVFEFRGSAASAFEGGFRRYADGHSVIGWGKVAGDTRFLTEVDADGNDVFDLAFDDDEITYRAVKVPLAQFDIATLRATSAK